METLPFACFNPSIDSLAPAYHTSMKTSSSVKFGTVKGITISGLNFDFLLITFHLILLC